MKSTDIAKIRHALENIITITNTEPHVVSDDVIGELARKALALLPCETCEGLDQVSVPRKDTFGVDWEPCPDCQPKSCICCEELTEENTHLHRNCGK